MSRSFDEIAKESKAQWDVGNNSGAAVLFAEARAFIAKETPDCAVVQLGDGRLAVCKADELAAAGEVHPDARGVAALHAKIVEALDKPAKDAAAAAEKAAAEAKAKAK